MAKPTGLGTASMELLRSTGAANPTGPDLADAERRPAETETDAEEVDTEGKGDTPGESSSRARKRSRAATPVKTKARNIRLSDDVHDRLWLLARQRKQTISTTADELLNKVLPRWEVKRQA